MPTETPTADVILKQGRDRPVRNRHPWIFSGAIEHVKGHPQPGDIVNIVGADGDWLAAGYYNPKSQIVARILTWNSAETIDETFWRGKLQVAIAARSFLKLEPDTTAYRIVNAEADGLPGLVADKYGDFIAVQCTTLGIDLRKQIIADTLAELMRPAGIIERSDQNARRKEGLGDSTGVIRGNAPADELVVRENTLKFAVELFKGHKTGLYLDQRENRAVVCRPEIVAGKEVLNAFCYTGGFGVYAAARGAGRIVNLDSSAPILEQAKKNITLNAGSRKEDEYAAGDAFTVMRSYADAGRKFDVVILDPPKFVQNQSDIPRAARGYKDLNRLAMLLLRPDGILATFSCSGLVGMEMFQTFVFRAAVDACRNVQILKHMEQAPDHPMLVTFPESMYLKGLLCRVSEEREGAPASRQTKRLSLASLVCGSTESCRGRPRLCT